MPKPAPAELTEQDVEHLRSRQGEYRGSNTTEKKRLREACVDKILESREVADDNEWAKELFAQASSSCGNARIYL